MASSSAKAEPVESEQSGSAWSEPMISYAQNQEDVRLRRLFSNEHVGFYIDVGANDPSLNTVTRYFYERGWRGINVEPVPHYFARLCEERPRDINLRVGLSDREGSATLYEWEGGLSTFSEDPVRGAAGRVVDQHTVRLTTLAHVCEEHVTEPIDFISIDVEGLERKVLEGADFARWRPLALVIEATQPNTREPSHREWEPIVLGAGFVYAAFDGLNRYYVRREDADLAVRLEVGPNVFDNWAPYLWVRRVEKWRSRGKRWRLGSRLARTLSRLLGSP